ncbi:MAG: hypothetical protein KDD58_15420 [Bdellovibrionales bacterium]|nr:hypothetical protein [Bdellovibrionales bacterium]
MKAFNIKTFDEDQLEGKGTLHSITVNSNRIGQECLFLNAEAENNWRHQYFMYVLNDKYETLQVMQPTHMDKKTCYSQLQKIESILKSESQVKVCVRDELKKKTLGPDEEDHFVQFSSLGNHKVAYDLLTLDSICSSKKCFSNNSVWVNTCPGFKKQ